MDQMMHLTPRPSDPPYENGKARSRWRQVRNGRTSLLADDWVNVKYSEPLRKLVKECMKFDATKRIKPNMLVRRIEKRMGGKAVMQRIQAAQEILNRQRPAQPNPNRPRHAPEPGTHEWPAICFNHVRKDKYRVGLARPRYDDDDD